jgi:glyoxylase-like metal-dependent hydrolase (beta-lactamase superfamily II)
MTEGSVRPPTQAVTVDEVAPGVHRIPLPLPGDALHSVNVYAIVHDERVTLVDVGWSYGPAFEVLEASLAAIAVDPGDIERVLVTHMHRDHYTLGMRLRERYGTRVLLGRGNSRRSRRF